MPCSTAAEESENDGFEDFEVEGAVCDPPAPERLAERGCPNALGWCGNRFTDDPQYGFYPESVDAAPDLQAKKAVFLAVLGDAGCDVRAPRAASLHGCCLESVVLSDAEVIGHGLDVGTEVLRDEAASAEVKYL